MPDVHRPVFAAEVSAAERVAGALIDSGMARMPARVLAAAMVDGDGRMTAGELADFLAVSPASVSGAVRMLTQLGMLRRERVRGSRRDEFVVDDDVWVRATRQYDQIYAPIKSAFAAAVEQLGPDHPATRRISLSLEFLTFVTEELARITDRWEERKRELRMT